MRNFRNKVPVEYELVALGIKPTKKRHTKKEFEDLEQTVRDYEAMRDYKEWIK